MTLRDVFDEAAAEIAVAADDEPGPDVATAPDGSIEWGRGGVVFAALDRAGAAASFRLDPVLTGAALRTPDTGSSPRGMEWVTFAPAVLDDHAVDRASAWFAAAYRRA